MAFLLSCWFIIEYVLIPDGFAKWYCLSFFINPFFLIFCQIFLWFKLLQSWFSFILFQPLRIVFIAVLWVFRFSKSRILRLFSVARPTSSDVLEEQEVTNTEMIESFNMFQSMVLHNCYKRKISLDEPTSWLQDHLEDVMDEEESVFHDAYYSIEPNYKHTNMYVDSTEINFPGDSSMDVDVEESNLHELNNVDKSIEESDCYAQDSKTDVDIVEPSPFMYSPESFIKESTDPFYTKYAERMRWYDLLNYERTCGISSIMNNKQFGSPSSLESVVLSDFSQPYMSFNKMCRKKLIRSLESDIELVYVGQTCLCWEALHHQYRRVEAELDQCSSFHRIKDDLCESVIGKFQKFQVLMERFMENDFVQGKRFWNYVQGRFSRKSLLQVPDISEYFEEDIEGVKNNNKNNMKAMEVLKAIENSIEAFWIFVQTDIQRKKSWWKLGSLLWAQHPPVEDLTDLKLLVDLTKELKKKEIRLKDVQGKKRCWLKRAHCQLDQETQPKEILFCMIEMELVSRVLNMSLISTPQLKWCQHKLDNIHFKDGRIMVRAYNAANSLLFPP